MVRQSVCEAVEEDEFLDEYGGTYTRTGKPGTNSIKVAPRP